MSPPPALPAVAPASSSLGGLLALVNRAGALALNFEDLSGVSFDVPDLRLGFADYIHTCEFCTLAKATPPSLLACQRNKLAAMRVAVQRKAGFTGMCHLGLTEIVEPLLYHGRVLGLFFYGSVVVKETEELSRQRLLRSCERLDRPTAPLLAAFERIPRISITEIPRYRAQLAWTIQIAVRLVEAAGVPCDRYRRRPTPTLFRKQTELPPVVQATVRIVHQEYAQPLRVQGIAQRLNCHPDYLSRTFKQAMHCTLLDYLARARVDRARRLLETRTLTVGEIADAVGVPQASHFCRVFRRIAGVSPTRYRRMAAWGEPSV